MKGQGRPKPSGPPQPPDKPRKTLLEWSGEAPSQSEELKRKAAAVYALKATEAAQVTPSSNLNPIIRPPARDPRRSTPGLATTASAPAAAPKGNSRGPVAAAPPVVPSIEQLKAAPRYGLNARELILQATAQLSATLPAAPAPQRGGNTSRVQGPSAPTAAPTAPRFDPSKLLEAMPPAARPQVKYVPRSSIPRLQRQGCCDTLLGQYLGLLLSLGRLAEPHDQAQALKVIKAEEAVWNLACTAASAHEASLYRPVTNKQQYTLAASKVGVTCVTLADHGGPGLGPLLQRFGLTEAGLRQEEGGVTQSGAGQGPEAKAGGGGAGAAGGGTAGSAARALAPNEDLFGEESEESEESEGGDGDGMAGGGGGGGLQDLFGDSDEEEDVACGTCDIKAEVGPAETVGLVQQQQHQHQQHQQQQHQQQQQQQQQAGDLQGEPECEGVERSTRGCQGVPEGDGPGPAAGSMGAPSGTGTERPEGGGNTQPEQQQQPVAVVAWPGTQPEQPPLNTACSSGGGHSQLAASSQGEPQLQPCLGAGAAAGPTAPDRKRGLEEHPPVQGVPEPHLGHHTKRPRRPSESSHPHPHPHPAPGSDPHWQHGPGQDLHPQQGHPPRLPPAPMLPPGGFSGLPPLPDSPPPPVPAGMPAAPDHAVGQQRGGGGGHDVGVAAQVAEFVRGVLDPLYRAQLLTKNQYKDIVKRSVRKVLDHHVGATSAAFLLREHEAVRRLVIKMVEALGQGQAGSQPPEVRPQ